jgi:hypothetical protein
MVCARFRHGFYMVVFECDSVFFSENNLVLAKTLIYLNNFKTKGVECFIVGLFIL